ncbi:hypothetical protein [Thermicanus aegyptius]|uniref:hypothetical protein n=1 Tax=Thermicanus aegyptius TaxID=94009 RepID=UPI000403A980|nr:hypothetical protein [Thermicanus aegyptius]
MRQLPQIPPYLCDTDFISSFLWINRLDILYEIYKGQIYVPDVVVDEIAFLKRFTYYSHVSVLLEEEIKKKNITVFQIYPGTPEGKEYLKLLSGGIGKGEAAVMSRARMVEGTVASNNLKDVLNYCNTYSLGLISTDDVLCSAVTKGMITETEGNQIWNQMKLKKRNLPSYDFSEAFRRFKENLPK